MARDLWPRADDRRTAAAAIVALLAIAGCGDDEGGDDATPADTGPAREGAERPAPGASFDGRAEVAEEFVGRVQGDSDAYASLTVLDADGRRFAFAYVCDGEDVGELFFGALPGEGESARLRSRAGGTLTLTRARGKAVGDAELGDGTKLRFSAAEVDPDGEAGLYLALGEDDGTLDDGDYGAWIVLPDGSQRGAINIGGTLRSGGALDVSTGVATVDSSQRITARTTGFIPLVPD